MPTNELYFVMLPLIHFSEHNHGLTEEVLTLIPDKNFATEFFEDEVQAYIDAFEWRAKKYLTGGHVTRYEVRKEPTENRRVIVRVIQHVS